MYLKNFIVHEIKNYYFVAKPSEIHAHGESLGLVQCLATLVSRMGVDSSPDYTIFNSASCFCTKNVAKDGRDLWATTPT